MNIILRKVTNLLSDRAYISIKYFYHFHRFPNLDRPRTFNEKLQWLKLHDRKPEYSLMVDKYEAKEYIAGIIGEEYVVPNYGVWNSFDEIDFDGLPDRFVLKTTHDCGGVVVCRDKKTFDRESAKTFLEKHLGFNYFYEGRELPYKNIRPRIIAEQLLEDETDHDLKDYKFYCFDGVVKLLMINTDRNSELPTKADYFNSDFQWLDFKWGYRHADEHPCRPGKFEKMVELAESLSKGLKLLRVDFYQTGEKIFVGELTFYDGSGFERIEPTEWDFKLGSWLNLPID